MIITKPLFDNRDYKCGLLDNNIKYVIVNDKLLKETYISVNVKAGSYDTSDGIAHFLEHMLFMGSVKYPKENYFTERISQYSGAYNAYTANNETCYYVNIHQNGLEEIIDIFSQFFINPLFLQDAIDREMNAINNEHLKNINSDTWVYDQLIRDISNIKIFPTGSLETLKKNNIRDIMIDFYNKFYVTDNISISIASNLSHDNILLLINNTFGKIKSKISKNNIRQITFKNKPESYYLESINKIYKYIYLWELPLEYTYKSKIQEFTIFGEILTTSTLKSFKFYLINKGYILNLTYKINVEGSFELIFILTEFGFNKIDIIESILFAYIEKIYTFDFKEIINYLNKISRINFNYINKIDTLSLVNYLSSNLHYYNDIYLGSIIIEEIKSNNHYINIYKKYINRDNQIRVIIGQNIFNLKLKLNLKKVSNYNSNYSLIKLDNYEKNNDFYDQFEYLIFKNIQVKPKLIDNLDKYSIPKLIDDNFWYGSCSKFNESYIIILFQYNNKNYFNTPYNYIQSVLSCNILNYLISIILYQYFIIGYSVKFYVNTELSTINVESVCLNDPDILGIFMKKVINFINNISKYISILSKEYIESLIFTFKNNIKNIKFITPIKYNFYILDLLTNNYEYDQDILLEELKNISIDNINNNICELFINSSLTKIVYGNVLIDNIMFLKSYKSKINLNYKPNIFKFWENMKIVNIKHNVQESNSVMYYYNFGKFNPKMYILAQMSVNILHNFFFNELRTKKQLGYLVQMHINKIMDHYSIIQVIQSNKPIDIITKYIDNFNNILLSFLDNKKINDYKDRVYKLINEDDNNIDDIYNRYSYEIINKTYLFNKKEILSKELQNISFDDLENFIKITISNKNCNKIIIIGH